MLLTNTFANNDEKYIKVTAVSFLKLLIFVKNVLNYGVIAIFNRNKIALF